MKKILTVIGARPQFIKAAPVSKQFLNSEGVCREILVHTGQHYDWEMSEVFFQQLGLRKPHYHLGVGSQTHARQTGTMLARLEEVILAEGPDAVLVYGDTNSTLAGALCAAKLNLPVAHVEAGLRSYKKSMPEEINRVLTDHMSNWLFVPTKQGMANLQKEGLEEGVHLVGDVMLDTALLVQEVLSRQKPICERFGVSPESYAVATVHRAENTDNPSNLQDLLIGLAQLPIAVLMPTHPRTRHAMTTHGIDVKSLDNIRFCEPLGYLEISDLIAHSKLVLTDSGGLQKEALFHGKPCVTLREETEWTETVESGWNMLSGSDPAAILDSASMQMHANHRPPFRELCDQYYGGGKASERIVSALIAEV